MVYIPILEMLDSLCDMAREIKSLRLRRSPIKSRAYQYIDPYKTEYIEYYIPTVDLMAASHHTTTCIFNSQARYFM